MKLFFIVYLTIGFIFGIYVELCFRIIPRDIIYSFISDIDSDIDFNQPSIRFIIFLICMISWPFILIKSANND